MPIKHLTWGMGRLRRLAGGADAPTFVSATTNEAGTIVTVTFSKEMADPTGKHASFTVNDGAANAVTAVALNATTTKIDLTLTNAVEYGDAVAVAYTKGTVESADGGVLDSFAAQSVTNVVQSLYQQWDGYPNSPVLTESRPFQAIVNAGGTIYLYVSKSTTNPLYGSTSSLSATEKIDIYKVISGNWSLYYSNVNPASYTTLLQANNDIYTDYTFTTVRFAKTT